jgi:diguanylate cyclase (GGDEF)-like protein
MESGVVLILLTQSAVIGGLTYYVFALAKRAWASNPAPNLSVHNPAPDTVVQQTLTTAKRTIEMHSGELSRFEHSLAVYPDHPATDQVELDQAFSNMRRANQKVEETIDSTLASLVGVFREMLNEEKSQLEAYRSRTEEFDSELGKIDRQTILASITAKVVEMVQELRHENAALRIGLQDAVEKTKELADRAHSAEQLARTDSLTKLPNRRFFDESHNDHHLAFERMGTPYTIILMDLDHFKAMNDRHGHQTGDAVLAMVGRIFIENRRACDYLCRMGGEEFALLIWKCNLATAKLIADRYRQKVESATLRFAEKQVSVTMSCGIAEVRFHETKEEVLKRADLALYQAKSLGRNRVFADESHDPLDSRRIERLEEHAVS